jgi:hypothetical protein
VKSETSARLLGWADRYARARWRVLPTDGKRALIADWPRRASSDPHQLEAWWRRWPHANIGLLCGNGRAVLDIDPRHGGDQALADLEHRHGPLPDTARVATGGAGEHRHFTAPPHTASLTLAPGLELKAAGRYVLAPPSVTEREYTWLRTQPVAALPDWLQHPARPTIETSPTEQPLVPVGHRHNALVQFLGLLRSMGFGERALVAFADAFLDTAVELDDSVPLDRGRAHATARNIAHRYPPRRNRQQ